MSKGGNDIACGKSKLEDRQQRAYAVWVSEIMLQQTQVKTVIDYYTRWMAKWPTLKDLAQATPDDVQQMWAGLGYYSRGRRLLQGAKHVEEKLNGRIPETYKGLLSELPGVGPYTAAAIASIAFGCVKGVVDGNVLRVLARLRRITQPIDTTPVQKAMQALSDALVDPSRPGDFNQAVMELGATTCTPKAPNCTACPLASLCQSHRLHARAATGKTAVASDPTCNLCSSHAIADIATTDLPRKKPKKQSPVIDLWCLHIRTQRDKVLLLRNPDTGLLASSWTFPCVAHTEHATPHAAVGTLLPSVKKADVVHTNHVVEHVFSHRKHRYHVLHVSCGGDDEVRCSDDHNDRSQWVHKTRVAATLTTTNMKKVWEKVKAWRKKQGGGIVAALKRASSTPAPRP
ncbi:A/G-specific adenine glycosylase [Salpingoeca rosetta]|uniref:Adenine DNA glycosylase n=1 Tax=Salpingoeca rosetta (strain ATCC 50818 / BSB-021) TaxID=946362 RepID=F2UFV0_SALR5|nr:A/G-specific adenine glycosylase [Salpingoeca rosetta]EGD75378.1 A/G-specific adenine glycosylase [Salpingoeca rosetta]|eukprot:XP_004991835.1 A/G-specific adenine glycosylase [Salpingoeca rosetta]